MKRRDMLKHSSMIGLGTILSPSLLKGNQIQNEKKLKILVAGAHPDDPETGCGGTIRLLANLGHNVIAYYFTKGEAGIDGISHTKAAEIRMKEAKKACDIMGAKAVFGSQVDGDTKVNNDEYNEIKKIIEYENPDIVFTHWPIDRHRDHRNCSNLIYDVWLHTVNSFDLFYFEVMSGIQTQNFNPTFYVDIESVLKLKHEACFVHKSQKIKEMYPEVHGIMEKFRGLESNYKYAEAFVQQHHSKINV